MAKKPFKLKIDEIKHNDLRSKKHKKVGRDLN